MFVSGFISFIVSAIGISIGIKKSKVAVFILGLPSIVYFIIKTILLFAFSAQIHYRIDMLITIISNLMSWTILFISLYRSKINKTTVTFILVTFVLFCISIAFFYFWLSNFNHTYFSYYEAEGIEYIKEYKVQYNGLGRPPNSVDITVNHYKTILGHAIYEADWTKQEYYFSHEKSL